LFTISILLLPYLTEKSRELRHFPFSPTFIYNSIKSKKWWIFFQLLILTQLDKMALHA
jgi:hypothetical protein